MIRNLKVLGLALVAVFAFAAVSASAASAANGQITSDGPFTLTGTDEESVAHPLTSFEGIVECHGHYVGEAPTSPTTPDLASGAETVTVTPEYENCTAEEGAFPATVTMNGCDYLLHLGETEAEPVDTYQVTSDLKCPLGVQVEIHIYLNAEAHEREESFCTITIEEQNGLTGATLTDETNGHLTLGGSAGPVVAERHGSLCPTETDTEGALDLAATIEGTNASNKVTPVSISHE